MKSQTDNASAKCATVPWGLSLIAAFSLKTKKHQGVNKLDTMASSPDIDVLVFTVLPIGIHYIITHKVLSPLCMTI